MLTIIGLSLDVVGAGVLAIGLFRPPQELFPGWSRDQLEAVTDYASGITGFGFLAIGFGLQGIAVLTAGGPPAWCAALLAAAVTLVVGGLAASFTFETVRAVLLPREKARSGRYSHHYSSPPIGAAFGAGACRAFGS